MHYFLALPLIPSQRGCDLKWVVHLHSPALETVLFLKFQGWAVVHTVLQVLVVFQDSNFPKLGVWEVLVFLCFETFHFEPLQLANQKQEN